MQVQHHVNIISAGHWPRCRDVTIQNGQLHCGLDFQSSYNLADAYSAQPHILFLRMRTDQDLRDFTRRWGPLFGFNPETASDATSVAWYWSSQRCLSALIRLINAVTNGDEERDALEEFVTAKFEQEEMRFPGLEPPPAPVVMHLLSAAQDLSAAVEAIRQAELRAVRAAATSVIRDTPVVTCGAGFDVEVSRRSSKVAARWKIDTLDGALRWMVWRDQAHGQPVLLRGVQHGFLPRQQAQEKVLLPECAHRVAAREWARVKRKRAKESKSKKRG